MATSNNKKKQVVKGSTNWGRLSKLIWKSTTLHQEKYLSRLKANQLQVWILVHTWILKKMTQFKSCNEKNLLLLLDSALSWLDSQPNLL